jgi:hypothetical protein
MALTELQRRVCRLIARNRIASGESYVAGGVALNELLSGRRVSHDVDLFHDSEQALDASWHSDRELLEQHGFGVEVLRERPSFVEAEVGDDSGQVLLQWVRDSAYRFLPLVEHAELGLVLHPVDLATNKTLALVGRLEARDWIDLMMCVRQLQPLGYLAWAACGKDPGYSPAAILEQAARTARYVQAEVAALAFEGEAPDAAALALEWRGMLAAAHEVIALLPPSELGKLVLAPDGGLFCGGAGELAAALGQGALRYHEGRIRGAYPGLK